jgi:hypothetical protein
LRSLLEDRLAAGVFLIGVSPPIRGGSKADGFAVAGFLSGAPYVPPTASKRPFTRLGLNIAGERRFPQMETTSADGMFTNRENMAEGHKVDIPCVLRSRK